MALVLPAVSRLRPLLLFAGLALAVVATEHLVTTRPIFFQRPALPMAVAFDVLVGLPALFYWLVVRRYGLPLSTLVAALGACLALATWLLPAGQQQPLRALAFLPALLEGATLALAVARAGRLWRAYRAARQHRGRGPSLGQALEQVLGWPGVLLVAESNMLRYAVLGWWAPLEVRPAHAAFSGHRESGFVALMATAGFLTLIETAAVHLVVGHWHPVAANWLTFLSLYTVLLLVAHAHAVRLCPVLLSDALLEVRVGFAWRVVVPRAAVAAAAIREAPAPAADMLNAAKVLLASSNVLLTFAAPVVVAGPYGTRRTVRRLALYLDQPRAFLGALAGGPAA
ncbi:hypothetical protein ACFQ48_12280 [Hymenobacter caeli]|uniref:Uncharacterized membrane protein (UPF0136 family) n=1 Tax=Hymenobacter caeli TaxID=2735894 RepID=A0ABX2FMT0_9BACT|nr:hypothetical protein [Hymenobacter caeli]NRT18460.1 uncharacterized membrane protein (UPF0136 family) [Hymenobacter caeli]